LNRLIRLLHDCVFNFLNKNFAQRDYIELDLKTKNLLVRDRTNLVRNGTNYTK
jgi:hypothetical protein